PRGLEAWLGDDGVDNELLEGERAAAEGLWLGLRQLRGLDVEGHARRFAVDRGWIEARAARQLRLGNLEWVDDGALLRVATDRWLLHDTICADLL
ncbi:MAG: hypothetical protein KC431_30215, partial [Myxococcales bacterium]|nr:hypothetical protein [Myxococcales bacterium]